MADVASAPPRTALPIIVGGAFLVLLPSVLHGPLAIDSALLNAVWTEGFARALREGVVYPRWLSGSFEGLGAPTFYFYPPIAFYLSGTFRALGLANGAAINLTALVALAASGLSMYAWMRWRGGRALLAALIYMAAPYHLTDFYIRAALAEFASFVWLPLIVMGLEAWPRRWAGPLLAVSYAGLCLTHLPMAVLTGVFLIAPMVLWKTRALRDWRRLGAYAGAGVAGVALAGIWLVPALTLERWISTSALYSPFYVADNWSIWATSRIAPAATGWPLKFAMGAALAAFGAGVAGWRARRGDVMAFAGIGLVCAAAGLALIPGLWQAPVLNRVQFPWRVFEVMEFAAVAALCSLPRLPVFSGLFAAMLAMFGWARIISVFTQVLGMHPLPPDWRQRLPDGAEYLPAGFPVAQLDEYHRLPNFEAYRGPAARGPVSSVMAGPDGRLEIVATGPGRIVVRRFSFPAWHVTGPGAGSLPTTREGPGQLLAFEATRAGRYVVSRRMLPEETAGVWLSLAGLALTGLLSLRGRRVRTGRSGDGSGTTAGSVSGSG